MRTKALVYLHDTILLTSALILALIGFIIQTIAYLTGILGNLFMRLAEITCNGIMFLNQKSA